MSAPFVKTIYLLLTSTMVLPKTKACFNNNKALDTENSWSWVQSMSMENHLYYEFGFDNPSQMTVKSEINQPKYFKRVYTCLKEYPSDNAMMVQVEQEGKDKIYFQCLRFESQSKHVVRQYKTKRRAMRKKVNCQKEKYRADEAMMVALENLQPQPCPLKGGYQMLLHEGPIIQGHCLDSTRTYNPSIRFQCDTFNVIADFGRDCQPPILADTQKMRRRHMAHLSCVGSWAEKGDTKTILLRMRDMPYTLWCIHYRQVRNGSEEVLSIFMTLDGRCVADAFNREDINPKQTGFFGHLISYVPYEDPRCSESNHLNACQSGIRSSCEDSNECPSKCNRCITIPYSSPCSFQETIRGNWKTIDSRHKIKVDVTDQGLNIGNNGEFLCRGEADRDLPHDVYPVVQLPEHSTCLPFYACARVYNLAPGVMEFFLRPAWRDENTGVPFTCKQTHDKIGYVIPVHQENTKTLIDVEKLNKNSCGFNSTRLFPTLIENCQLEVSSCRNRCDQIDISYNKATCGQGFPIDEHFDCFARLELTDGIRANLVYSVFSERYFCFFFASNRLFIGSPDICNADRIKYILSNREASTTYDPALAISRPVTGQSGRGSGSTNNNNSNNKNNNKKNHANFFYVSLTCLCSISIKFALVK